MNSYQQNSITSLVGAFVRNGQTEIIVFLINWFYCNLTNGWINDGILAHSDNNSVGLGFIYRVLSISSLYLRFSLQLKTKQQ